MIRAICVVVFLLSMALAGPMLHDDGPVPLPGAHAHNDYLHEPPLLKALAHGFTSVEADIFLVGDALCVAHDIQQITPQRTLQSLYLEPIRQRVTENGGHVYGRESRFILMIDIKSAAEPTYQRLHAVLAGYREMLTTFEAAGRKDKAILVVVSGNRPVGLMESQPVRYAGRDGRLTDLDADIPAIAMPMISDQWARHFTWRGEGAMPAEERQKLKAIVRKAHAKGRLVRFWATPDAPSPAREAVWQELLSAGVDLINTDDLHGLQEFLLQHGR